MQRLYILSMVCEYLQKNMPEHKVFMPDQEPWPAKPHPGEVYIAIEGTGKRFDLYYIIDDSPRVQVFLREVDLRQDRPYFYGPCHLFNLVDPSSFDGIISKIKELS